MYNQFIDENLYFLYIHSKHKVQLKSGQIQEILLNITWSLHQISFEPLEILNKRNLRNNRNKINKRKLN
jgi:hypothetical protein